MQLATLALAALPTKNACSLLITEFCIMKCAAKVIHLPSFSPSTPGKRDVKVAALALAALPTHYFFSFLFYTDVGATAALLLCYLLALR